MDERDCKRRSDLAGVHGFLVHPTISFQARQLCDLARAALNGLLRHCRQRHLESGTGPFPPRPLLQRVRLKPIQLKARPLHRAFAFPEARHGRLPLTDCHSATDPACRHDASRDHLDPPIASTRTITRKSVLRSQRHLLHPVVLPEGQQTARFSSHRAMWRRDIAYQEYSDNLLSRINGEQGRREPCGPGRRYHGRIFLVQELLRRSTPDSRPG